MIPRVVILTAYFRPVLGGVESNAERLAQYLAGAGVPVQVVTKRISRALPDRERVDGVVPVERIGPLGARSPYGKWAMIPAAIRWLVAHRAEYDVTCCVDFRGIGLAPVIARHATGRPVLLQAQTPGAFSGAYVPGGRLGGLLFRPVLGLYRRADAFACIGHALEQEAVQAGIPAGRVHFLPNAIDMQRFRPADRDERVRLRRDLGVAEHAVVCVFVGRLSREKGILELVQAWDEAVQRRAADDPPALLLVAGPDMDGHPWNAGPEARAFVANRQLEGTVRFLGGGADIAALLRAADVAVQPSHFEAQGLSAIEALASGLPVVASAVGGLLDFVVDERNGLLVPPRDPRALADGLLRLLDRPEERSALAARARESVARDYDEQAVFDRLATLLQALAEGRS